MLFTTRLKLNIEDPNTKDNIHNDIQNSDI